MILPIVWILVSLVLLYYGAEWLVRGSADFAARVGLTPLVIGLTVVAYGTSMPELLVSTKAALVGQGDIAVGNVVGSNVFNIGMILGLSAILHPLKVQSQILRLDAPIMLGVSAYLLFVLHDSHINRLEAAGLAIGAITYTVANIHIARRETSHFTQDAFEQSLPQPTGSIARDLAFILVGLGLLVAGSRLLVHGSVALAVLLGVSEAVIGLTIIAAGTSMPELATSLMAAWRRQPDIAVGNVIGSNIFNILCILGVSGLVAPLHAPGIRTFDVVFMLALTALLLPLLRTKTTLQRGEGAILVAVFAAYLYMLWPN